MHFSQLSLIFLSAAFNSLAQNLPLPGDDERTTNNQPQSLNGHNPGAGNQLLSTSNQGEPGSLFSGGRGRAGAGSGSQPGGPRIPFEFGSPARPLPEPQYVTGRHDCGGQKFDRGMRCDRDGGNTGPENAVFVLAPGATLSNCVIGPDQIEGVHCEGECALRGVWFEDVCEDAVTFRQERGTSLVVGGGAFNAVDKIMNHNGGGTVVVQGFYCERFGKVVRSCSDCENMSARAVVLQNVWAVGGLELVGLNANSGDRAQISGSCVQDVKRVCSSYEGGSGADGGFGGGGESGGQFGNGMTGSNGLGGASLNSGEGGGSGSNQQLRTDSQGQPAELSSGGGGSASQFPGTGIDGDGLSVGDPAIEGSGPSQQCQYAQADIQNCPPF